MKRYRFSKEKFYQCLRSRNEESEIELYETGHYRNWPTYCDGAIVEDGLMIGTDDKTYSCSIPENLEWTEEITE